MLPLIPDATSICLACLVLSFSFPCYSSSIPSQTPIAAAVPAGGARFVQALALGDTRGLSDQDWEVLRATGLTHLIAISGFHVGLVAGFGALVAPRITWANISSCLVPSVQMLGSLASIFAENILPLILLLCCPSHAPYVL